ncbi:MAG: hypothetical protein R3D89_11725 [Sphingomonadaceae bacterium]
MNIFLAAALLANQQFRVHEQADPLDDHISIYALAGDNRRHLAVGCEDASDPDSLRVVIKFGRYIGEGTPGILAGGTIVQYRFDKGAAQTVRWYSFDEQVLAEPPRTKPLRFISELRGSTKLFVRAHTKSGNTVDIAFTYDDPTLAVDAVLEKCGHSIGEAREK